MCNLTPLTGAAAAGILVRSNLYLHVPSRTLQDTRVIERFKRLQAEFIDAFSRSAYIPTLVFTDATSV
jgi:hypothetical protein